jgi:hypothetical protein
VAGRWCGTHVASQAACALATLRRAKPAVQHCIALLSHCTASVESTLLLIPSLVDAPCFMQVVMPLLLWRLCPRVTNAPQGKHSAKIFFGVMHDMQLSGWHSLLVVNGC